MPESLPPKVFISYSHDSPEHNDQVLALADRLRADGIEALIDQYELAPPEGWTRWIRHGIKRADFVLVICTESYKRRAEGNEETGKGLGGNREGLIIDQSIYESDGKNDKFIAVTLRCTDSAFIPDFLRPYQSESTEAANGYEHLYRRLTNQPEVVMPELGRLRSLPPRERKTTQVSPADDLLSALRSEFALFERIMKSNNFGNKDKVFFHPHIPTAKLAAVTNVFRGFIPVGGQTILMLYDTSLFGSAKDGVIVTLDGVGWRTPCGQPEYRRFPAFDVESLLELVEETVIRGYVIIEGGGAVIYRQEFTRALKTALRRAGVLSL